MFVLPFCAKLKCSFVKALQETKCNCYQNRFVESRLHEQLKYYDARWDILQVTLFVHHKVHHVNYIYFN